MLAPHGKPLVVFETLVNKVMELPKLNRNSVGNVSSIACTPRSGSCSMNDFTLFCQILRTDGSTNGHEESRTIILLKPKCLSVKGTLRRKLNTSSSTSGNLDRCHLSSNLLSASSRHLRRGPSGGYAIPPCNRSDCVQVVLSC